MSAVALGAAAPELALAAATSALVNCHVRESGAWRFDGGRAELDLPDGRTLAVAYAHRTPTDRLRLAGPVELDGAPVDLRELGALLVDHLDPGVEAGALHARIADSAAQVERNLAARADDLDRLYDGRALSFLDGEQALLVGHPLHPTAKSREELGQEREPYSPELRGRFRLHWLAVDPSAVEHGSAEREAAPALARRLLRTDPETDRAALAAALRGREDHVLIPAHPWQLTHQLAHEPRLRALVEAGLVTDLGPHGAPVTPTSSLRTVHGEALGFQLKFSLDVRVTNSRRVSLRKELHRAVEGAALQETVVGTQARAAAPLLDVAHDPAFLAVRDAEGVLDGLSVLLRRASFAAEAPVCLASLCEGDPRGRPSRLGALVRRIAQQERTTQAAAARSWFEDYCAVVVHSLVRLYLDVGLCFEPHQQNTLLVLGPNGRIERCVIRDSQGFFHREAAHADLCRVVPALGEATESIFPEALADERLVYYPFLNAAVGVIDQLGLDGVGDERELLGVLRDRLEAERSQGGRYPHTLLDRLLDDERWPCKANLRTRVHDLDELVGDIAVQSVYVTIPNPLRSAA